MTAHSRIGPSALSRLLACPGSHQLSTAKPRSGGSSYYAAEGTVAHSIVECALADSNVIEGALLGDTVNEDGHSVTVDQDMIDGTDAMIVFCQELKDKAKPTWVEARVDLAPLWAPDPVPEPFFGTMDFGAYVEEQDTLYVVDFKYGRLGVHPLDNPQAQSYGLGACFELGFFPSSIINVIIQPRGTDSQVVKVAHMTGLDLRIWADDVLRPGIDALYGAAPLLYPGDHCRFCPAKAECPALTNLAKKQSRAEFSELPTSPVSYTDTELGEVLDWATCIEMWIAEIRAEASGRIENSHTVQGWKLVPKRGMRKWTDATTTGPILDATPELWDRKLKSPTQVEKLDKEVYDQLFEGGHINSNSSGSTLAPTHDPREAVAARSAKDDFGIIEP